MGGDYQKGIYNQLMEVMARLDTVERELCHEKTEHKDDVDRLNAKIDGLMEENQLLRDDNARLKGILNNDSSNTSNPPSTDQKGGRPANTYNGRKKSGRKAGGQKGHGGVTLTRAQVEDKLRSGKWDHRIKDVGGTSGSPYIRRYVVDLDVTPLITEIRIHADGNGKYHIPEEYRSEVTYGSNVKAMAAALYSEGVMSNDRIAAFLNAVSGDELGLSNGSVYHFCKRLSEASSASIGHLEEGMLNQPVVSTDATTVTVNGKQAYIRNFSTGDTVIYHAMKEKNLAAMKEVGFLKRFAGILMHDHETALYHFGTGHAECNVHIIRYLRKNTEETGNRWSDRMLHLLCEMNRTRKSVMGQGWAAFPEDVIQSYEEKYRELIALGREENRSTEHRYAKKDEKALLNRMEKYMGNHLLFLHNFAVPFDDNMSERDLRKAKNREKMAGGFRKDSGHEMYCSILTIIETLKRRGMGIIENIKRLFQGTPAIF